MEIWFEFYRLYNQCNIVRVKNILRTASVLLVVIHSLKTISRCLVLLTIHIVKFTFIRNADWRDEESIFLSGLKVNSRNAKLYNNVGHALESQKKFSDALVLFKEAAKVDSINKTRRKSSSCFSGAARRHWGSHKHWASTKLFNQVLSLSISRQSPEKEFQVWGGRDSLPNS